MKSATAPGDQSTRKIASDASRQAARLSSRRRWLQGVGVSLALPLLARDATADDGHAADRSPEGRQPRRMVCVANPLGFVPGDFFPDQAGPLQQLTPLLQPLGRHRESMTVFSGLDHGVSGGHQGVHSFLSGIRDNDSAGWANRNVTLDQIAAETTVGQVRFPSLVAAAGSNSDELACRTSWTRTGVNIPPVTEASRLFEMLFGTATEAERRRLHRTIAENTSVLDAVFRQANDLKRTLSPDDRRKIDEYLTSVRSVEQSLANVDAWVDRPRPQVDLKEPDDSAPFTQRLPVFYELIALALQTDSTRVATLAIPGNLPVGDLGIQGNYHAFSHHGKSDRLLKPLLRIERYQIEQFANFLDRLQGMQTPDGQPLLDSTMVLCGSGMGNASSHSNRNLPVILAGGKFRHGQHVVMPTEASRKVPLCNLFTTMLQQFGCEDLERFNTATGSMSELVG